MSNTRNLLRNPSGRTMTGCTDSRKSRTSIAASPREIISRTGILFLFIGAMTLLVLPAGAYETPESIVAASKVYVSDVVYDPGAFFDGDTGTVNVYVTNANTNQSSVVNHVTFGDQTIRLTSQTYDTTVNIGPLQTQAFTFSVVANGKEGTYYPTFSLSFRDADSLYYRAPVKIDNSPLILTVVDKPDAYAEGQKKTVYLQIANPRDNDVSNAIVEIAGNGITATPATTYIGTIAAGSKIPVNFTVSPEYPTTATITLKYDNGDNTHTVTRDLPINFGVDKKQASPQLSNIKVTLANGVYHVTGDVTNAGLTTANGVAVAALSPATPQDPYRTYVIGALKPDDFGSFEVTFAAEGVSAIPVQISYKDADGNIIAARQTVSISQAASAESTNQPGGNPLLPVIGLLALIGIAGFYLSKKRQKKQ